MLISPTQKNIDLNLKLNAQEYENYFFENSTCVLPSCPSVLLSPEFPPQSLTPIRQYAAAIVAPGMTKTSVKVTKANHSLAVELFQASTQYTKDSSRLP